MEPLLAYMPPWLPSLPGWGIIAESWAGGLDAGAWLACRRALSTPPFAHAAAAWHRRCGSQIPDAGKTEASLQVKQTFDT